MIINMSTYKNCNEYKEKNNFAINNLHNNNNNNYSYNDNTNNKLNQLNYINNFKNEIRSYLLKKGSKLIYVLSNKYEDQIGFENLIGNDKQIGEVLRKVEGVFGNRISIFLADLEIKKTTIDDIQKESNNHKISLDNIIDSSNIQVIGLFSNNVENNYPILPINSLNNIQYNNSNSKTTKVILICKN